MEISMINEKTKERTSLQPGDFAVYEYEDDSRNLNMKFPKFFRPEEGNVTELSFISYRYPLTYSVDLSSFEQFLWMMTVIASTHKMIIQKKNADDTRPYAVTFLTAP